MTSRVPPSGIIHTLKVLGSSGLIGLFGLLGAVLVAGACAALARSDWTAGLGLLLFGSMLTWGALWLLLDSIDMPGATGRRGMPTAVLDDDS